MCLPVLVALLRSSLMFMLGFIALIVCICVEWMFGLQCVGVAIE